MKICFFLSLITFFVPLLSKTYEINSQHSFIRFNISYLKISRVEGHFREFKGYFEFDHQTKNITNIDISIKPSSINTDDKKRDNHLRKKDFFDTKRYPLITFKGKRVILKKGVPSEVEGDLLILKTRKSVRYPIIWKGEISDPWDSKKKNIFLEIKGIIKRKDFGITWNKKLDEGGFLLGEDVPFSFVIEANPTDQRTAFSRFFVPSKKKVKKTKRNTSHKLSFNGASSVNKKKGIPLKKKSIQTQADVQFNIDFFLGIIILLFFTGLGFWFKLRVDDKLISRGMKEWQVEALSDTLTFLLIFSGAIVTAPLMGYGVNPIWSLLE